MNQQDRGELFLRIVGELPDDPFLNIKLLNGSPHVVNWLPNDLYYVSDRIGVVMNHGEVERFIGRIREFYARITPAEIDLLNEDKKPREFVRTDERPGSVYIFRHGDRHKIGFTRTEIEERRHQVELAIRRQKLVGDVVTVYSIATERPETLEAKLHQHFSRQRIEGEWFDLNADMLARVIAFAEANR